MSSQLLDTPAKHPFTLTALADRALNKIASSAFRLGWAPLTRLCEALVISLMDNIDSGHLRILTYSNIYVFPAENATNTEHRAEIRVLDDAFWVRVCAMGDLGFAEAYMFGDCMVDDLVSLFQIFLDNREKLSNLDSKASYLFTLPQKITSYRFLNTLTNAKSNCSSHYDISNDMFAAFLSSDMTYSCAIFKDVDADIQDGVDRGEWSGGQGLKRVGVASSSSSQSMIRGNIGPHGEKDELYEAQIRKIRHIIRKARIKPGHRVLEIGSGWGSMAIEIARTVPDTVIDTLTLSVHQQTLARQRIVAAGFQDRITVHLLDYRSMPPHWQGAFDRFISVEMIEAVGSEFLTTYWQIVDWALRKKNAIGVIQVITIPEARFERYIREIDFIRKWIFPGGFLPHLTLLLESLRQGSKGRLTVDSVANIGPHYARTLREWRRRFAERFDTVIVPALQAEYPDVMNGPNGKDEIEVFRRKWIYYFCYCEIGFTTRTLGDHIITFTREGCQGFGCDTLE